MTISLTITGRPTSKGNSPRIMKRGRARWVAPSEAAVKAEKTTAMQMRAQYKGPPLEGALIVDARFYFARPKKNADMHCLRKVDRGNLLKLCEDSGNGILWIDDSQIVGGSVSKHWGAADYTIVEVREA